MGLVKLCFGSNCDNQSDNQQALHCQTHLVFHEHAHFDFMLWYETVFIDILSIHSYKSRFPMQVIERQYHILTLLWHVNQKS